MAQVRLKQIEGFGEDRNLAETLERYWADAEREEQDMQYQEVMRSGADLTPAVRATMRELRECVRDHPEPGLPIALTGIEAARVREYLRTRGIEVRDGQRLTIGGRVAVNRERHPYRYDAEADAFLTRAPRPKPRPPRSVIADPGETPVAAKVLLAVLAAMGSAGIALAIVQRLGAM